ncbi:MAG: hypothetical protein RL684_2013 [Pseudomonadota bacterium]|jgi:stringent starvation protein B
MGAPGDSGSAIRSRRPYLLRAMHEWMGDSGFTPHVIVDATRPGVAVPTAFVKDGKIVLNISLSATQRLQLLNESLQFDARFGGIVHHVHVPITAVLGIYARETGEGMVFNENEPEAPGPTPGEPSPAPSNSPHSGGTGGGAKDERRAKLTVVK